MPISLKQLQAFVAVSDLGSFRRAAERLNTTQPNISTRIATLEELLGLSLMRRDAGSVTLSPKGAALLPRAREVLQSVDGFLAATGDAALLEGTIRLGVTEIVAHVWLGDFLTALKRRYPSVVVELNVDFSANLSEALAARTLDLGLLSAPFEREISGRVGLAEYPMLWVAPPEFGLGGRGLTLDDIATHPILTAARGTLLYRQLHARLTKARIAHAKLVPSTNLAASVQMAIGGLGVACVPRVMATEALSAGQLVPLDLAWAPDALKFEARYHAETAPVILREAALLAAEISARHRG